MITHAGWGTGGWLVGSKSCLLFFLLASVDPAHGQLAPTERPEYRRGKELSHTYCTACHLYPEPDLHDLRTWRTQVMPLMHRNAGIGELQPDGTREEREALEQWRTIWEDYYFVAAPERPLPQGPRPPIRTGLKLFAVENPKYRQGISYATLVQIDPQTRQVYVGNALTRSLDVLDSQGKGLATTKLDSTLVHLLRRPEGWIGTQIGMVVPDDRPLGRLTQFSRDGLRFEVRRDCLTGLVRPLHCAAGDLNGDGREDLVICSFGNRTGVSGQFAWYENRGDNLYAEHVLLDRPGATRAVLHDDDGDGRVDILVLMAQAKEGVFLFHNLGRGEFAERPLIQAPPAWGFVYFDLADFNADGHPDLITANGDLGDFDCPPKRYHGVRIYLNDGRFNFHEAFLFPMNGVYKAIPADFDDDGDLDIAAISFFPDYERSPEESFVYLENQGELKFTAATFPDSQRGRWIVMDAGDVDGDGDLDLVLGAGFRTPFRAPDSLKARWEKEGPSLLILRNQRRSPEPGPSSPPPVDGRN